MSAALKEPEMPVWSPSKTEAEYIAQLYAYFKTIPLKRDEEEARKAALSGKKGKTTAEIRELLESWKENPPERQPMKYTVIWRPEIEKQLANAYLNAKEDDLADEFTLASDRVDRLLAVDPIGCSESRQGETRVLIELPIAAFFTIDEADHSVTVIAVHYAAPPKR